MSTIFALPESPTVAQQLAAYRSLLEQQRRDQVAQIIALSMDGNPAGYDAGGGDSRFEDLRVTAQLIAAARRQLEDTEAALRRMDAGTYGSCVRCRQPIPVDRLEILPAARFCVGCQRLQSSRR